MLGDLILDLMNGLGSASHPLRSLAYVELLGVVKAHDKNPYTLVSPHLNRVSVHLVSHSVDVLNEGVQFLGVSTVSFLETTLSWTLPSLVLQRRRDALDLIVRITGRYLGVMLMDNMAGILSLLFMQDQQASYEEGTNFLMGIFNEVTLEPTRSSGRSPRSGFSLLSLLTSCTVVFLTEIVVNWGDAGKLVVDRADQALRRAQNLLQGSTPNLGKTDIGTFLKDHMLGIISGMNDILVDGHGKKSVEEKQKVVRSLGGLIQRVGSVIATFAPQVSWTCCLQSGKRSPNLSFLADHDQYTNGDGNPPTSPRSSTHLAAIHPVYALHRPWPAHRSNDSFPCRPVARSGRRGEGNRR